MRQPKFDIGQTVKLTGNDTGGVVRSIRLLGNGHLHYLVGHRIEGGREFLRVYDESNLRAEIL